MTATIPGAPPATDLKSYLQRVVDGGELTRAEAADALDVIMTGGATPVQVGALLTALRMRGETIEEIAGFAETMRRHALRVSLADDQRPVVDTCGTGGDGANTFNVSTTAAFVVAAAGARVAKHGNRSITSQCGSADLLEGLGVRIELTPEQVASCVDQVGIGFMFAPAFHPSMRYVGPVRKELGVRTIFNMLGPITNPAGVRRQLIGVGNPAVARRLASVLAALGSDRVLVVSSHEGLDEIGIGGDTFVVEYDNSSGTTREYSIHPDHVDLPAAGVESIRGGTIAENVGITRSVLAGVKGAPRDATIINAAAALYASGLAASLLEGAQIAAEAIDSGRAARTMRDLVDVSQAVVN